MILSDTVPQKWTAWSKSRVAAKASGVGNVETSFMLLNCPSALSASALSFWNKDILRSLRTFLRYSYQSIQIENLHYGKCSNNNHSAVFLQLWKVQFCNSENNVGCWGDLMIEIYNYIMMFWSIHWWEIYTYLYKTWRMFFAQHLVKCGKIVIEGVLEVCRFYHFFTELNNYVNILE